MGQMKRILALVLTLLLVFSVVGCGSQGAGSGAPAAEKPSKLQEVLDRGYLIVGTGSTNVPWHYKDEAGELQGFDIEMGRILAMGLFGDASKVEFVEQSPDARIPNILTGKVDVTFQFMTISPVRAQQVAFSVPYYTEGIGLIMPTGGKYKNYAEMVAAKEAGEDITIAILQNVTSEDTVQRMIAGAKDDQYENQGLVYQAVTSGRADAGAVDLSSIMWLASKEPEKYIDSGFAFNPQNYGAALDPTDQVWINFVDEVLIDAMTGQSYKLYQDAFEKYFGTRPPAPEIGKPSMFR